MKTVLNTLKTGKFTCKTMKVMSGHQKRKRQPTHTFTCLARVYQGFQHYQGEVLSRNAKHSDLA